jgi:hypothetical protein
VAFVRVMSCIVAYLQGRWRAACDESDAALEMLHTRCTGVAWEICTAHTIGFVARCALGEWAESARRLPVVIRDAQARGDRYSLHSLRVLGCAHVLDLAADEPDKARLALAEDIAAWSYKYYDLQRAAALIGGVDVAMYDGAPDRAMAIVRSEWGQLERSMLLRLPTSFVFSHGARGRAALAMAAAAERRADRQSFTNEAAASARAIARHGPPWAKGLASLLMAGVTSCTGDRDATERHLTEAEAALEAAELTPLLMAARCRLSTLRSKTLAAPWPSSVVTWVESQGIRKPELVFAGMAPGAWEEVSR